MVHQNQAGFILADEIHPLLLQLEAGSCHAEHRQQADQGTPKDIRLDGLFMTGTGQGDCFIVIEFFDAGFQNQHVLSSIGLGMRFYTATLYRTVGLSSRIVHIFQRHFPCTAHICPFRYAHISFLFTLLCILCIYNSCAICIYSPYTCIFNEFLNIFVRYIHIFLHYFPI